jgi:hypothetical protein
MSPIPTLSRIFADRNLRELRRLEALHAGHIAPGARTWREALSALYDRLGRAGGPKQQTAILRSTIDYLDSIPNEDCCHIMIAACSRSRSATLYFATLSAGQHPFRGASEEGVNIMAHAIHSQRDGTSSGFSDVDIAYVSKHAIGRLHEREHVSDDNLRGVLGYIGVLGHLTRHSEKHITGQLCLYLGDALVVGSLKHGPQYAENDLGGGHAINGTFLDIRTVLPADEVRNQDWIEQGLIAGHVVKSWFTDRPDDDSKLADAIPFLPRREDDYTMRAAGVSESYP